MFKHYNNNYEIARVVKTFEVEVDFEKVNKTQGYYYLYLNNTIKLPDEKPKKIDNTINMDD